MRVNIDDQDAPIGVIDGVLSRANERALRDTEAYTERTMSMANNWATTIVAWAVWGIVASFNIATLTFLALGIGSEN